MLEPLSDGAIVPVRADGWESHVVLKDGTRMPLIGFGTQYGFSEDGHDRGNVELGPDYVAMALRAGLRLVDTARGYGTEHHVMPGIVRSGIDRTQVFIITKALVGIDHASGRASSRAAIEESASRLGGYIDLYLVHHPVPGWQDLWRALEDAKDAGLVRSIGVSNFTPAHLEELRSFARHPAVANQILLHPFVYRSQEEVLRYCVQHDIAIIAFPRSPWHAGKGTAISEIAARHRRTVAQVMLRWAVDHRYAVIALSTNEKHLKENFEVRDFGLMPQEIAAIDDLELSYFVDEINADFVQGWALNADGVAKVEILIDGVVIGDAVHGRARPDVAAKLNKRGSLESGFNFYFPDGAFEKPLSEVSVAFKLPNGTLVQSRPVVVPRPPGPAGSTRRPARKNPFPVDGVKAPFPLEVIDLIRDLRGEDLATDNVWSDAQIKAGVDDIILLAQRGSRRTDALFRYLSYLKAVHSHTEFVARYFPRFHYGASIAAKDAVSVASTPAELLCIAHHLYVLKSRGLSGHLLEFGCFKGFSTACLSFACYQLEIWFDVFDSFEGLPPSDSDYYSAGDFAGSLDEVRRNVREFGKLEPVTFHKGFFSDTLPGAPVDALCIWMDVDLEASSRDVMAILPALRRESCVFSHEAFPDDFLNGRLTEARGPDSPLVPIVDAYTKLGRDVQGRYLTGNIAAFWETGAAVPVMPYEELRRLVALL